MKKPALIGLLIAAALLAILGVVGAASQSSAPAMPDKHTQWTKDCGGECG